MAGRDISIKSLCKYNGHSVKANRAFDLALKFNYDELPNYIRLVQLLNENVTISAKKGDGPPKTLGVFMIKEVKVDHDGIGMLRFNSMMDSVEPQNINDLVSSDEPFRIKFDATVEDEDEDE